jgi:hypothetical protein
MKLSRTTPCNVIEILTPIWGGGNRKVGVARHKIGTHNEIHILVKNKEGLRIYPNPYYASGEQLRNAPSHALKNYPNIILHELPIDDLEFLERE